MTTAFLLAILLIGIIVVFGNFRTEVEATVDRRATARWKYRVEVIQSPSVDFAESIQRHLDAAMVGDARVELVTALASNGRVVLVYRAPVDAP